MNSIKKARPAADEAASRGQEALEEGAQLGATMMRALRNGRMRPAGDLEDFAHTWAWRDARGVIFVACRTALCTSEGVVLTTRLKPGEVPRGAQPLVATGGEHARAFKEALFEGETAQAPQTAHPDQVAAMKVYRHDPAGHLLSLAALLATVVGSLASLSSGEPAMMAFVGFIVILLMTAKSWITRDDQQPFGPRLQALLNEAAAQGLGDAALGGAWTWAASRDELTKEAEQLSRETHQPAWEKERRLAASGGRAVERAGELEGLAEAQAGRLDPRAPQARATRRQMRPQPGAEEALHTAPGRGAQAEEALGPLRAELKRRAGLWAALPGGAPHQVRAQDVLTHWLPAAADSWARTARPLDELQKAAEALVASVPDPAPELERDWEINRRFAASLAAHTPHEASPAPEPGQPLVNPDSAPGSSVPGAPQHPERP